MDLFKEQYPIAKTYKGMSMYTDVSQEALASVNVCFIFTKWKEIQEMEPSQYRALMKNPLGYDGRNIYAPKAMRNVGVE